MEVLVVESDPGAALIAIAQLEAAGHRVRRCHEAGASAFPCVGLDPGRCPLEVDPIDVVLTVRSRGHARPTAFEDGVTCALRRRTPVVVAGRTTLNPFERLPHTIARVDEVVEACEHAAKGPRTEHEAVASASLDATLDHAGIPRIDAYASVRGTGDGLRVTLRVPPETPKPVRDVAAVRVVGALRAFDRHAPRIEATCTDLSSFEPANSKLGCQH